MSKRFIDTELYDKEWFMRLSPAEKCAIIYIRTKEDCIGIWKPNYELAKFQIGADIDWVSLKDKVKGQFDILSNGKWFDMDFCFFQYGVLNEDCKPHIRYIAMLKESGLLERVLKGYAKGINTLEEQEQEPDKEKEKEKEKERATGKFKKPTPQEVDEYCKSIGFELEGKYFCDKNDSIGWLVGKNKTPMKDWKAVIRTWKSNSKPKDNTDEVMRLMEARKNL